ncbi:MAG: sugar phosphate isomerase/epimerase [Spirochaetes bacterium]|nr:sugar phosphate isomerase/epimerase [Spirochaetota bacterium]
MHQAGIWTSYLIDQTPEEMVKTFAAKGWNHLEFSDEHGKALLDRGGAPEAVGAQLRRFAEGEGVFFPQGHLWLVADLAAQDGGKSLDLLKRWLDLYGALGIQAAVLHPGAGELQRSGASPEAVFEARTKALGILTAHLGNAPLRIALENIPGLAPRIDDLIPLVDSVGEAHVGICLDTGHLHLGKGDPADFVQRAGRRLIALHIADNEGQSDQHLMPYGRGTVDWKAFAAAVKKIGYAGLWNLEIPGENRCPLPIRLMKLDYYKKAMEYMMGEV